MKGQWLAKVDDREYGPYTWEQMLQMAAEGRVTPGLPVRRVEDKEWMAAEDVPNLLAAHPSQPVPPPPPVAANSSQASPTPPPPPPAAERREAAPTNAARLAPVPPPPPRPAADLPIIFTAPPAAESAPRGDDAAPSPGRALWKVGLLLAGVAAAVALFCVTLAAFSWYRHGQAAHQRADSDAQQSKSTAAVAPASHRSSDAAPDKPAAVAKDLAAQAKLVKSIPTWNSLATLQSFGVGNVRLQVERIWLTDAQGAADAEKKDAKAGTSQPQRYVCIQVAISSKVPSPLKYKGWNTTGPTGAILADAKLNVLPLVPISQTPELKRHSGGEVPAGGTTKEVLVFAAPQEETDVMYLVLPYKAFYANVRTPYMALELTPDVVGHDLSKPQSIAEAGGGTSPADATTAGEEAATEEPEKKKKLSPPKSLRDQINAEADKKP